MGRRRRLSVFDERIGEVVLSGAGPADAARCAIERGLGASEVVCLSEGIWSLDAGPSRTNLAASGFLVTASDRSEAERGCYAIASVRRVWGSCSIVPDEEVPILLAMVAG